MVHFRFEKEIWKTGAELVAGIDEVGRGPLAGPVVAAAVILTPSTRIKGVDDSKKLKPHEREDLYHKIVETAVSYAVGIVPHDVIDEINIYQASLRAMAEAVARLQCVPQHLLIDGPRYQTSVIPFTAIIDGDAKCFSIAAASIIAKVTRDKMMAVYDTYYPQYGFARHKGYATQQHLNALQKFGRCGIHRKSFRVSRTGEAQA